MFVRGLLKRGIPESVRFWIGDLSMYIFFIPTHPYYCASMGHLPAKAPDNHINLGFFAVVIIHF